jgi:hypothetical protein
MRATGVVDSGALVMPASVAQQLGLTISGTASIRYANGQTAIHKTAEEVYLSYAGRKGVFSAIIEPNRDSLLIGAIVFVLEELDLLVDCVTQRLIPRDPERIISEVE